MTGLLLWFTVARAAPHPPSALPALGDLRSASTVAVDTDLLTLTTTGGLAFSGVADGETAVFTFGTVDLTDVSVRGSRGFALLAHGDLYVRGRVVAAADGTAPGPGGHEGGRGQGAPGGGTGGGTGAEHGASGGGHCGDGGAAGAGTVPGGAAYGDLADSLTGGSGGARSSDATGGLSTGAGGGGGGAIELGAGGRLILFPTARIDVQGGGGSYGAQDGGGGGAGGAILLHGRAGSLCEGGALLLASGGDGGFGDDDGGGGGGGGCVLAWGVSMACEAEVAGGEGGGTAGQDTGDEPGANGAGGQSASADPDHDQDGAVWSLDCDDHRSDVQPGATEIPGDGTDQDCDGEEACAADADGDGARADGTVRSADLDCDDEGEAPPDADLDCDDADPAAAPGAPEIGCNGQDDDCDPSTPDCPPGDDTGAERPPPETGDPTDLASGSGGDDASAPRWPRDPGCGCGVGGGSPSLPVWVALAGALRRRVRLPPARRGGNV